MFMTYCVTGVGWSESRQGSRSPAISDPQNPPEAGRSGSVGVHLPSSSPYTGNTEERLKHEVLGVPRSRGHPAVNGGKFDHTSDSGYVPYKKGDYHDALRKKNNQVALLLVECLGGVEACRLAASTSLTRLPNSRPSGP